MKDMLAIHVRTKRAVSQGWANRSLKSVVYLHKPRLRDTPERVREPHAQDGEPCGS
jgi:hypothetical protein